MDEIWKDIPGYEGKYQVSNTGQVKSLNYKGHGEIKLLKQAINYNGYKRVSLYKDGKQKHYFVHRLVAMTFIPNPDNLPIINHKDEDKINNNVNNLEWCTHKYNNNYGTVRERLSESTKGKYKGKNSPNAKPILMYDREGNFIRRFDCIHDTNEYFGKKNAYKNVSACLRGINKTVFGYVFKYADEK